MKLYDCQAAPNPRRVRIFIAEKGIEIPTVELSIIDGDNLKPEFLAVNPRGVLATLELDDGTAIDEAPAICSYLEAQYPDPPLLGTTPVERAQVISWDRHMEHDGLNAIGEFFRNSAAPLANRALAGRTGDAQIPALIERGKRSAGIFYERLEARLGESEYVAGPNFSLADITALCSVDFAVFAGFAIPDENKNMQRWHKAVSARPSASA